MQLAQLTHISVSQDFLKWFRLLSFLKPFFSLPKIIPLFAQTQHR